MWDQIVELTPGIVPWLALATSLVTGIFGIRGYLLSRKIQRELKSDEVLVGGDLHTPSLDHPDHENCVLQTTIFNKSRRKAVITKVEAFDSKGEAIEIHWSDRMDRLGNIQGDSNLLGVVDSTPLCIRRNDGNAFLFDVRVEITHSFSNKPMVLRYDIPKGWQEWFAKQ